MLARPVSAAPQVTVTGATTIRITQVQRAGDRSVTIEGELRDASLLSGLADEVVVVTLSVGNGFVRQQVRTDSHGTFRVTWPLPLGSYRVGASFGGSPLYAPSNVEPQQIDISKLSLDLGLDVPQELDASLPRQSLEIQTSAGGSPADVQVSLHSQERMLGTVRTGSSGQGLVAFPTAWLGKPGPLRLRARFEGDGQFNPAEAVAETTLITPVTLELEAAERQVVADGMIALSGAASDLLGPVGGGTIGIHAMGRHLASATTGPDGAFSFELAAEEFPPGPLELEARFTPAVVWRRAARSEAVSVRVLAPRPIPLRVFAAPAAATFLVVGLLLLLRLRPRILGRIRRRRGAAKQERRRAEDAPLVSGLQPAKPGLRTLLKPDSGIGGTVWDAADERPVAGAEVVVEGAGGACFRARADGAGRFALEDLADGSYRLMAGAPGYVTERFEIQLPHRGQLRGMRILLVPVRIRVLEIYRRVALPLLPEAELWACWTPRELLSYLRREPVGAGPAFERLSALLEGVYWGPPPAAEQRVEEARKLAAS